MTCSTSRFSSSVPSDVGCQIWGAGGGALSAGGVEPADLFLGNDVRNPVSGALFVKKNVKVNASCDLLSLSCSCVFGGLIMDGV